MKAIIYILSEIWINKIRINNILNIFKQKIRIQKAVKVNLRYKDSKLNRIVE